MELHSLLVTRHDPSTFRKIGSKNAIDTNFWNCSQRVSHHTGVISKSGFQYGKFANNLFSILKQLVTVPKMGKTHHISNMTVWDKMAIFETTAKNSVLGRCGPGTHPQYEKKMKKFDLVRILSQNHEIPLFW